MANTATLAVKIVSDSSAARRDIAQTSDAVGKWGARADKVGRASGRILAGGLLAAGAAAVKFGQQASDLAETQSKVNVIFGKEGAAALDKFASSAATNLGQSKQAALDAAATFGTFGKVAGLQGTELAGFSTKLTTLASDMASFSNTDPEVAVQALGAALRGESEPIRKFGVLLDDATLRNEALKLGLIKTTKQALTPQQKVLAAQSSIMKQTSDAQGDFERTSGGLANQQRILKATLTDMSTELGAKLLPIMVKATAAGLKMVAWIDDNQRLVGILVIGIGSLVAVVWAINAATRAWTAVQLAFNTVMSLNPVGLIVIAVIALVAAIVIAYKKSETFRKIVDAAFHGVQKAAEFAFNWIKDHWKLILLIITGPVGAAVLLVIKYWDKIKGATEKLINGVKTVLGWLKPPIDTVADWFKAAFNKINGFIQATINKIQEVIRIAKIAVKIASGEELAGGGKIIKGWGDPRTGSGSGAGTEPPPNVHARTTETINVTVQGSLIGTTEERVGDELVKAIDRARRVRGLPALGT